MRAITARERKLEGVLPEGYYALGEQVVSGVVPDVMTLERREVDPGAARCSAAALTDPRATICAVADDPVYPTRPRVLVIRHVSGDRVVAILEIVSPANKRDTIEIGALVEKSVVACPGECTWS